MDTMICYCYRYTAADIRQDVRDNDGRSLLLEKIMAEKKKGACRCARMHPEGR